MSQLDGGKKGSPSGTGLGGARVIFVLLWLAEEDVPLNDTAHCSPGLSFYFLYIGRKTGF